MTISFSRVESFGHLRAVPDPKPNNAPKQGGKIPSFAAEMASAAGAVASPPPEVSAEVRDAARGTDNLLPPLRAALKDRCSIGEVCGAMRDVFGDYQPTY